MNNTDTITLLCEDTVDGIFTAIYKAWEIGTKHTEVQVEDGMTMSLFSSYKKVDADAQLAFRVADSISRKISDEAYGLIYNAALSDRSGKAQYIYRFLQKGFKVGKEIINYLQDDDVRNVYEMSRFVWRESHKYMGFVRFEELESGVLCSRINPRSNVVPLIAEHFSDRLNQENWVILDTNRNFAAVHRKGEEALLINGVTEEQLNSMGELSEREKEFQSLWDCFYHTIAISERKNDRQQMLMMPKRYRKYMKAENSRN